MNQIEYQRSIVREEMYEAIEEPAKILATAKAKEARMTKEKRDQKEAEAFSTLHLPLL